jgi:hypothetical protein
MKLISIDQGCFAHLRTEKNLRIGGGYGRYRAFCG